jgi:uncharacterized protein YcbK (DUF882 family)
MGDLSKNFSRSEFECTCGCGLSDIDPKLIEIYQAVRDEFGPVRITSGCRCLDHNRSIGSKDTSQHILCKAGDGKIKEHDPAGIVYWLDDGLMKGWGGLGIYDTFFHIDTRKKKARWDVRTEG